MNIKMNMKFVSAENDGRMNYAVFYPDNYENLPLITYLHGAGERGLNFEHVYRHAIPKMISEGKEFPAIILVPQCPGEFVWDNVVCDVKRIIDTVVHNFSVLPDRIAITGSSMGGYGTWMMGMTYGNFFSGIAPIAGGAMQWRAVNLISTPIYAMHGTDDNTVLPIHTELTCEHVNAIGGKAVYKKLLGFGHSDGINYAYSDTDVIDWLIAQRRTDFSPVKEAISNMF